jgi:hypothetical protein
LAKLGPEWKDRFVQQTFPSLKIIFMKSLTKPASPKWMLLVAVSGLIFFSCQKQIEQQDKQQEIAAAAKDHGHLKQTKTFSSETAQKWLDMQLRILRLPLGPNPYGLNGNRYFAYCGIGLYESVVGGMPEYRSLSGQLTSMPAMPELESGKAYYWPASANAALAFLSKSFYTLAPTPLKSAMDSLERALNATYQSEVDEATFQRSVNFGRSVAQRIFDWSKADGSLTTWPPYAPPVGPGIWSPTAPNPTAIASPYWGYNRLFVQGSLDNTSSPPPPPYSTDPGSAYYAMVKNVYDISQTLTPEQIATALYFNDNPGFQGGTHYISIFSQVLHQEDPQLDFFALAQAQTGISLAESQIGCWKIKYQLLVERPIRYIRDVLGHATWNPVITTHPHPEFPSGHAQTGGAFAAVMTSLLGSSYQFTLHTYDNLGMTPRSYTSFMNLAEDIGRARVYGGIHYTYTCNESIRQGGKIVSNILARLQFKK